MAAPEKVFVWCDPEGDFLDVVLREQPFEVELISRQVTGPKTKCV